MTTLLNSATIFFATWCLLSLFVSLLWIFWRNPLNATLRPLRAETRVAALRFIALLPLSTGALLTTGLFELPGLLIERHCHHNSCAPHNPVTALPEHLYPALIAVIAVAVMMLGAIIYRTRVVSRQWQYLSQPEHAHRVLPSSAPIACTLGLARPVVYLSRGLVEQLAPVKVAVIAAHERAHVARFDNLWMTVLRIACLFWMRRRDLFDDIELAQDQACDRFAARTVGDATLVAETLLQCRHLRDTPTGAASFLRGHLAARIECVLRESDQRLSQSLLAAMLAAWITIIAIGVPLLHEALETVI